MNIFEIMGHLGGDPEIRFTGSGQKVTNFSVAVKGKKSDVDSTMWIRVICWGDRFDKIMPYFKKGSAIIVVGELQKPEIKPDKQGNNQVRLEMHADIIKFSPFGRNEDVAPISKPMTQQQSVFEPEKGQGSARVEQEDLPF